MSGFRRMLMMTNNSSDMNMYDIIENHVFALVPSNGTFTGGTNGIQYEIKQGHTYHVILKSRTTPPSSYIGLFTYKSASNTPNKIIASFGTSTNIAETYYTHNEGSDYAYIGVYCGNTSMQNANYNCVVYIEDIT